MLPDREKCDILSKWEIRKPKAAALHNWRDKNPPDERKEGDSNDYISGFLFVLYVRCCPY